MDKKIIKKLDNLHQQISEIYHKRALEIKDYVDIYDMSFEAVLMCSKLTEDEMIPLMEKMLSCYNNIYEIRSVFAENAESIFGGMDKIIETVNYLETSKKLLARTKPNAKNEESLTYQSFAYFNAYAEFDRQKKEIAPFLGICRILCDIFASENVYSEEYKKYRQYHDRIATFLDEPARGFCSRDWERMEMPEVKLIISEIEKQLIVGINNPLNSLLCYPYKGLLDRKNFLTA